MGSAGRAPASLTSTVRSEQSRPVRCRPHGRDENSWPAGIRTRRLRHHRRGRQTHAWPGPYAGLLYEHGGFVDDILVHKIADDHYFLCVNASNQREGFRAHPEGRIRNAREVDFARKRYVQLAIQGPRRPGGVASHFDGSLRNPLLPFRGQQKSRARPRESPRIYRRAASRSTLTRRSDGSGRQWE